MSSLLLTTLDTGNTAWMIMATILVLLMSIPGIALFYGGLVQFIESQFDDLYRNLKDRITCTSSYWKWWQENIWKLIHWAYYCKEYTCWGVRYRWKQNIGKHYWLVILVLLRRQFVPTLCRYYLWYFMKTTKYLLVTWQSYQRHSFLRSWLWTLFVQR